MEQSIKKEVYVNTEKSASGVYRRVKDGAVMNHAAMLTGEFIRQVNITDYAVYIYFKNAKLPPLSIPRRSYEIQ